MTNDSCERFKNVHEHYVDHYNQGVHMHIVIKNFIIVGQFFNDVARKKGGKKNKKDVNHQNNPSGQIPDVG